jgi:hypothetical protein
MMAATAAVMIEELTPTPTITTPTGTIDKRVAD